MARYKNPLPPVECAKCGSPVNRRRPSKSGLYYCLAPECQAERRRLWHQERTKHYKSQEEADHAEELANGARVLMQALWAPRIQCPVCGLTNALRDWVHFNALGDGCNGTGGGYVPGYTLAHANAIWPPGKREYAPVAE